MEKICRFCVPVAFLRRFFLIFAFFVISLSSVREVVSAIPTRAVIVIDTKGNVIYEINADKLTQPASLAKMMTLLLTFRALERREISFNSTIVVSRNAARQRPCIIGLKCGDRIAVKDAILALITKSANDAAVALAEHISCGSVEGFVTMMNKEAKRLGMNSTVFVNPSGWKNSKQLTTARDMSKLSLALLKEYPKYYRFFSTKTFHYCGRSFSNHNKLLGLRGSMIVDGIKTGFVNASGFNLATSAVQKNRRLIMVFLGGSSSKQLNKECELILKRCFANISSKEIVRRRKQEKFLHQSEFHKPRISKLLEKITKLSDN